MAATAGRGSGGRKESAGGGCGGGVEIGCEQSPAGDSGGGGGHAPENEAAIGGGSDEIGKRGRAGRRTDWLRSHVSASSFECRAGSLEEDRTGRGSDERDRATCGVGPTVRMTKYPIQPHLPKQNQGVFITTPFYIIEYDLTYHGPKFIKYLIFI